MNRRPVIGITAALEQAGWTVWADVEANVSQRTYSLNAADAGAIPVILPPDEATTEEPGPLLDLIDALLLSGGSDIDPSTYGERPGAHTQGSSLVRDRFELALARAALDREMPVLGICRGMELLNVACGGTLEQHLPDADLHLHTPGQFSDHDVRLEPGTLAARVVGAERASVRSHHHQGIARLGEGLVASGWAEPGGAIEAIEMPARRWAVGILWHAEEERRSPVIGSLAVAAREQAVAA